MHGMALGGVVLIVLAFLAMGLLGGWNMPGWRGGTPHMGWSSRGGAPAQPAVAGAPVVPVSLVDFTFRPRDIRVRTEQPFNLQVTNQGGIPHDLTIPALGVQVVVRPGQQVITGLQAPVPGTYDFYCSVPGHREAGMIGRLIVE